MLLLLKLWLKLLLSWLEILLYWLKRSLLERGDRFGRALIDLPDKALQTSREGVGDSLDLWSAGCAAELQIWNRFVIRLIIILSALANNSYFNLKVLDRDLKYTLR